MLHRSAHVAGLCVLRSDVYFVEEFAFEVLTSIGLDGQDVRD